MSPSRRLALAAFCVGAWLAGTAAGAAVPDILGELGVSAERLNRIDEFFEAEVRAGRLPGVVALVIRDGAVVYGNSFGDRDPATHARMSLSARFRLYSMTKPVTTVAVLQLAEDGLIRLDDPIAKYLPEFTRLRVYTPAYVPGAKNTEQKAVPATKPPTILDFLRHTSGLTYGQGGPANARDYKAAGLVPEIWLPTDPLISFTNANVSKRIAAQPLAFEPGTQWAYGRSTDVLGRLIEVVSGMPLDAYFDKRIFAPLGMSDTGFNVPNDEQSRIVQPGTPQADAVPTFLTDLSQRRQFLSGGGGLVGGVDYGIFCQMLLGGGMFEGIRVLGARSVALMTSDQIGHLADHPSFNLGRSYTFGLGVFIRRAKDPEHPYANVGEFGWWGGAGTAFWGDPKARICGVLLMQQPDETRYYAEKFRALVYDAMRPAVP